MFVVDTGKTSSTFTNILQTCNVTLCALPFKAGYFIHIYRDADKTLYVTWDMLTLAFAASSVEWHNPTWVSSLFGAYLPNVPYSNKCCISVALWRETKENFKYDTAS